MIRPDLHLHTTASDGRCDPYQTARLVQRADVTLFSVTDHDTLSALPETAEWAYERGLAFIPGVEISTEGDDEVHILGYGVNPQDPVLNRFFQEMAEQRVQRVRRMGEKLAELGMPLPLDEIIQQAPSSVGRPHLGRALAERGYAADVSQAFSRFLGVGMPAYVPRQTPTALEAIALLRSRGAVPVLAHPGLILWPEETLLARLDAWQQAGLRGLEVYHPANRGRYAFWDQEARKRGLLVTGGSDFHGDHGSRHGQIGETAGEWPTALMDGWALFRAVQKNNRQ